MREKRQWAKLPSTLLPKRSDGVWTANSFIRRYQERLIEESLISLKNNPHCFRTLKGIVSLMVAFVDLRLYPRCHVTSASRNDVGAQANRGSAKNN